jgi:hypothetical protein
VLLLFLFLSTVGFRASACTARYESIRENSKSEVNLIGSCYIILKIYNLIENQLLSLINRSKKGFLIKRRKYFLKRIILKKKNKEKLASFLL